MYGFDQFDSYGYPGGLAVASIASVDHLVLTPLSETVALGTNTCVSASVRDAANQTLPGVRVDYAVSGPNPGSSFAVSDANGKAAFCYTGQNLGDDTITASVGGVSAQAHKIWEVTAQHAPRRGRPVGDDEREHAQGDHPHRLRCRRTCAHVHRDDQSHPRVVVGDGTEPHVSPERELPRSGLVLLQGHDGLVDSAPATVSITVTSVNNAPVADAQSATTAEDTPKAIALSASDVDGDPLTYGILSGPSHGALTGTGAARTYTPDANYSGPDSFVFTVNDGTLDSNTATVSIAVTR